MASPRRKKFCLEFIILYSESQSTVGLLAMPRDRRAWSEALQCPPWKTKAVCSGRIREGTCARQVFPAERKPVFLGARTGPEWEITDPEILHFLFTIPFSCCIIHFEKFAELIGNHVDGIVSHAIFPVSSGKIERINNMMKTIRRSAYG